jgi:hypothetical protein
MLRPNPTRDQSTAMIHASNNPIGFARQTQGEAFGREIADR